MDAQKLISLLAQFKRLGIDRQIDYDKFYLYSLITHSTAIEGSTVTEIENQLLFDEGIAAKGRSMAEQLMNLDLKAAYERAIGLANNHDDFTIDRLKELASIVMKNTGTMYHTALGDFSSAKGDLRLLNVTAGAGGRSYMNYSKVPAKLEELCANINSRRKTLSGADIVACYNLSFDAHFHLVTNLNLTLFQQTLTKHARQNISRRLLILVKPATWMCSVILCSMNISAIWSKQYSITRAQRRPPTWSRAPMSV